MLCWLGDLVAGWIEDDEAARAVAGGCCGQARRTQGQVEQATLAGGHGREGEGFACGVDALDCRGGGEAEIAIPVGLEVGCIEGDAVVLLRLQPQDFSGDVFDGVEEFAVAFGEQRGVGAGDFYAEFGSWSCGGRGLVFAVRWG